MPRDDRYRWCVRGDLNPHPLIADQALNLACLPFHHERKKRAETTGIEPAQPCGLPGFRPGPLPVRVTSPQMVGGEGVEPSWGQAPPGPEPGASTSFASRP